LREVTDRDLDRVIQEATVPVLVEFWKPGCGSCRALTHELEQLELTVLGKVLIVKINVEEQYQIPAELEINSLPALAYYRNGRFERFIGGIGTTQEILKQLALT